MMAQPSDHDKLVDALAAAQREIDRLKAETEQAKSSYANLFESAGDSIFIIDVNTYTIIAANAHAARRFGYAPDELIGLSMEAQVDIGKTDGRMLADGSAAPASAQTAVYASDDSAADAQVRRVIAANGGGNSARNAGSPAVKPAAPVATLAGARLAASSSAAVPAR